MLRFSQRIATAFTLTALLVVAGCDSATNPSSGSQQGDQKGDGMSQPGTDAKAPAFTLTDTKGQSHSLSDFAGKWVVLEWTNHGCPYVKKHYNSGNMQSLQEKYTDSGVVWLSICSSAPGKQGHMDNAGWQAAIADKGIKATAVLIDEDGAVGKRYGATTTPHMFVINPDGDLVYRGAIDSVRSTDAADIEQADNYVAAVLDAGMAGEELPYESTKPYGCSVKYAN